MDSSLAEVHLLGKMDHGVILPSAGAPWPLSSHCNPDQGVGADGVTPRRPRCYSGISYDFLYLCLVGLMSQPTSATSGLRP